MFAAPATYLILGVTALYTWLAFTRPDLFERMVFRPDRILRQREYHRLVSSALIHVDWIHFAFNAVAFVSFGETLEIIFGTGAMVALYVGSILGGSLLSLAIHRHHDYSAVGASGGVSGLIFASIFLLPGMEVGLFFLPIGIPGWLFAILFLLYSFFGMRRGRDNIGHDAHLGGALVGLALATLGYPRLVLENPWLFAAVVVLTLGFFIGLARHPHAPGQLGSLIRSERPKSSIRYQQYDDAAARAAEKRRLDELLDRVSAGGLHSLTEAERRELNRLSDKARR